MLLLLTYHSFLHFFFRRLTGTNLCKGHSYDFSRTANCVVAMHRTSRPFTSIYGRVIRSLALLSCGSGKHFCWFSNSETVVWV